MKKNLPIGNKRKRWIDRLSDFEYNNLKPKEKEDYLRFQKYSQLRETKLKSIIKKRDEVKKLKDEIRELDEKEESNFLKVQFLHNTYRCRIDIIRQERKSNSIKLSSLVVNSTKVQKSFIRKTYKGEKLVPHFVYHGKVVSSSLEKPKNVYFQTEDKLKLTISKLTKKDVIVIDKDFIKKFLQTNYSEYVVELMRKSGMTKFNDMSIKFDNFIKWYSKTK